MQDFSIVIMPLLLALAERTAEQLLRAVCACDSPAPPRDTVYLEPVDFRDCRATVAFFADLLRSMFNVDAAAVADLRAELAQVEPLSTESRPTDGQRQDWPAQLAGLYLAQLMLALDALHDATGCQAAAVASAALERYSWCFESGISFSRADAAALAAFVAEHLDAATDDDAEVADTDAPPLIVAAR